MFWQGTILTRQEEVVERHSETDIFHTLVSAEQDPALCLAGPFSIEPRHHARKRQELIHYTLHTDEDPDSNYSVHMKINIFLTEQHLSFHLVDTQLLPLKTKPQEIRIIFNIILFAHSKSII